MKKLSVFIAAMSWVIAVSASTFNYKFNSEPLSKVLVLMAEEHPDLHLNFIYNELENYKVTANIATDDADDALRKAAGLNPVSVVKKGGRYYIEALQHGKFLYSGRVVGADGEPMAGVTLMLLSPNDSTVVTYGFSDKDGGFAIPCDRA